MPFGFFRHRHGGVAPLRRVACAATVWLACSAPDGSDLFQPFGSAGSAGSAGQGGTLAGTGGSGGAGGGALGAAAGRGGEGIGGNLPLAGAGGTSSSSTGGTGASPPDAGDAGGVDAGSSAPEPDDCVPSDERCDGIDNDCDGVIDSGAACPADCTGFSVDEHAYMICAESVDRAVALVRCGGEDMKLAWIETAGENAALVAALAGVELPGAAGAVVQIGASDQDDEDEWSWIGNAAADDGFQFWSGNAAEDGGDPVGDAFANWADGEPNNSGNEDCGVLVVSDGGDRDPGQWDDRACNEDLPFLCEEP